MTLRFLILICVPVLPLPATGQEIFAPAAGMKGSTAIPADSGIFVEWATDCVVERGPGIIMYPDSVEVSFGKATDAAGRADLTGVVSLGDGGVAELSFERSIRNGPGFDFAVFENAFNDAFLELAFVEVSSDGTRYVRFPAQSLTPAGSGQQVGTFGTLDPVHIHNLAGKYRAGYGTPFDLEELKDSAGLDTGHVRFIRVIDVIGILDDSLGSRDAAGRLINDPYPTPFHTGGFDLDAVGVIHVNMATVTGEMQGPVPPVYPNPFRNLITIRCENCTVVKCTVIHIGSGKTVFSQRLALDGPALNLGMLEPGMYLLRLEYSGKIVHHKIFKL